MPTTNTPAPGTQPGAQPGNGIGLNMSFTGATPSVTTSVASPTGTSTGTGWPHRSSTRCQAPVVQVAVLPTLPTVSVTVAPFSEQVPETV